MTTEFYTAFLTYQYPELKELTLSFLTLVSSIFTFSVIFAEKLTKSDGGESKGFLLLCMAWLFFLAALVCGGIGLAHLFYLGDVAKGNPIFNLGYDPNVFLIRTTTELFMGGVLFVVGMALLAGTAFMRFADIGNFKVNLGVSLAAQQWLSRLRK